MKLASLKPNSKYGRDGKLVVVSRDLSRLQEVQISIGGRIIQTLQGALDDWKSVGPQLRLIAEKFETDLKQGRVFHFDELHSPLPRAYQWADGSAYVTHVELVRKSRGAEMPESFWTDPLMYQGGSDSFLAPTEDICLPNEDWGIDFEAEVAVITDDVPMGVSAEAALNHIQMVMLVNDVSLRNLIPAELAKGFGFFQSKPSSAFSPVAVTLDELGSHWRQGRLHLPILSYVNETLFGRPNAGVDMTFHFGQLISHAAKTRPLIAGTIIGSGTVANQDPAVGSSCIAERRSRETIERGSAQSSYLCFGDRVKIEMRDPAGKSIFGSIDAKVARPAPP